MAKIPDQIGKYKILSHLGSGGSSIVYLGMHPTLKRKVVLKKLNLRGKKSFYESFLQEAALMMDLNHDHIVKVYDHFKEGSRHYMVMEFVEGVSLDQFLEKADSLNHDTIRYILRCCCKALIYIHERKIIHRDIKPSNIFISNKGDVKLGDFGIAMHGGPLDKDNENTPESYPLVGTPAYMAPEQFAGKGRITPRTDLYALGVTYFELLTKQKLFYGETLDEMRRAVLKGRHPSLLFLIRSYGFNSWRIIRRCIFRAPILRFSSSKKMLRALRSFRMNDESAQEDLSFRIQSLSSKSGPVKRKSESVGKKGFSQVLGVKETTGGRLGGLVIVSVFILLLGGSLLYSGRFYQWFLPDKYGRFLLELTQDTPGDSFPLETLELYRDEGGSPRLLDQWNEFAFEKKPLVKRTGFYRLKVSWGNRVIWKSFYLPPMTEQQDEVLTVELSAPPLLSQLLEIDLLLSDGLTGQLLDPDGHVFIQSPNGEFSPLSEESMVVSGLEYLVKADLPGYYEAEFDIVLEFYQNSLILEAALKPLPGQLIVHHNMDSLSLKINNRKKIKGGNQSEDIEHFGSLNMEGGSWLLSPGIYELTWAGSGWKEKQKLTIRSEELVVFRITQDENDLPRFDIDRKQQSLGE
ncbi:serine/threonine protein kinase [Oceanispirochaeta crateris]|uniref:Serine/threonine protein kinase n=1 Tax=Oceanispirochaeta crateris TaxID=2518645 RepID=A0A5C1QQX3_9SPIO|nr:serine/threonine-protein kinase [Oceanispirochaeta crateris]QEN08522.1 serine/threonine protein kinase [Oceanispirochaeta crateris]